MKIVYDALYGDHLRDLGHPESPDRVEVVAARLRERGFANDVTARATPSDDEIERVHTPRYVELVKREIGDLARPRATSQPAMSWSTRARST